MEKLNTIQKREKLNDVFTLDKKGNGGANHTYGIAYHDKAMITDDEDERLFVDANYYLTTIQLQNGARKELDSIHGVIDTDLLEIVRHRLQCFQQGNFATRENEMALNHIEEALMWMNRRVEDRIERSVLGTNNQ